VPAASGDTYLEVVLAGHETTDAGADAAGGVAGHVVQTEDRIDGEPVEQPVRDHRLGAESVFFGGLEDQVDGAGEAALSRQDMGGAQQHGHVAVVAAGVHDAVVLGPVGPRAALGQREAVHVGA
jgi:hypothetical protein